MPGPLDDSKLDPRAQAQGKAYSTYADQEAELKPDTDLSKGVVSANLSSMCPCGHVSVMHGVGIGGSNNAGVCEMKGCHCSGFANKPNQGMGWAYEYPEGKETNKC